MPARKPLVLNQGQVEQLQSGDTLLGGGASIGQAVLTLPDGSGVFEHVQTIASVGIVAGQNVIASISPHQDSDENSHEMLDLVSIVGLAITDAIEFTITFREPTSGPVRINYQVA